MIDVYAISAILVIALVTMIIRFLPFVLFKNKTPKVIDYLGKKLPYAIMALLVVYCLKDTTMENILPTVIGVASVVIIHLYKKNILLSIVLGTALYMLVLNIK